MNFCLWAHPEDGGNCQFNVSSPFLRRSQQIIGTKINCIFQLFVENSIDKIFSICIQHLFCECFPVERCSLFLQTNLDIDHPLKILFSLLMKGTSHKLKLNFHCPSHLDIKFLSVHPGNLVAVLQPANVLGFFHHIPIVLLPFIISEGLGHAKAESNRHCFKNPFKRNASMNLVSLDCSTHNKSLICVLKCPGILNNSLV